MLLGMQGVTYVGVIGGILFLFGEDILRLFEKKKEFRFGERRVENRSNRVHRHIESLIHATTDYTASRNVSVFIIGSISLFLVTMMVIVNYTTILNALFTAALFGLTPYLYLRIKLNSIRVEGSYEGNVVVRELVNQYRINFYNIIEAIERVAKIKSAPVCEKAFYLLSIKIKECKTKEEIIHELETLTFIINTEWMKMLANNIYMALEFGTNITSGLEDILFELKESKEVEEKRNQLNIESFSILKFLSPAMYLATLFIAIEYFDFTLRKFMQYQLKTEMGIKFLTLILFLTILNSGIMLFIGKKKFDI